MITICEDKLKALTRSVLGEGRGAAPLILTYLRLARPRKDIFEAGPLVVGFWMNGPLKLKVLNLSLLFYSTIHSQTSSRSPNPKARHESREKKRNWSLLLNGYTFN